MTRVSESTPLSSDEANVEQREYWRHEGARQYQENEEANEAVIVPFGQAMLEAARLQPGERVLDVGCGRGASTVEAAERVAPSGLVVGVDISATMLQAAQARCDDAVLDNVELIEADAQVHDFDPGSFDVVISRFGVMFFDDPQAAFANLARALRPGGRLHFVCPQDQLKSEWVAVAFGAAVEATGGAPEVGQPGAPGPFAFADDDRLGRLLTGGGFREPRLESIVRPVRLGPDIDAAVAYILSLPESEQLFAGAPRETVHAAKTALRSGFAPYAGSQGVVMDASAWLMSAHR
ncbi:MAG TPA: methyltransferase domain-containing protein [Lapillicoccus sp.]|nr:methyltransferase domain-containing protein [Lapillicoccus sp.]